MILIAKNIKENGKPRYLINHISKKTHPAEINAAKVLSLWAAVNLSLAPEEIDSLLLFGFSKIS